MQLFYFPHNMSDKVVLPADESRHLVKVLRKKVGDIVHATDGIGNLIEARILTENHRGVELEKLTVEQQSPRPYEFTLAISPVKNNDRLEWCIEKATEIGVSNIVLILCKHAERKKVKYERLERIIVAAMKQSNQFYKPQLKEMIAFDEFLKYDESKQKFIAHCVEQRERVSLTGVVERGKSTSLMIGPEGDFSEVEIEAALSSGYRAVSLGNTRLRTETAAVVGTSVVAAANE